MNVLAAVVFHFTSKWHPQQAHAIATKLLYASENNNYILKYLNHTHRLQAINHNPDIIQKTATPSQPVTVTQNHISKR